MDKVSLLAASEIDSAFDNTTIMSGNNLNKIDDDINTVLMQPNKILRLNHSLVVGVGTKVIG